MYMDTWQMSVQAQISHIQLATTQGPVLRGQVPTATLGLEKSTAGSTEPPPPDKDGIVLQPQRIVLVSLLSLVHSQQSRAFQNHTQPDWFLLRADRISLSQENKTGQWQQTLGGQKGGEKATYPRVSTWRQALRQSQTVGERRPDGGRAL